jgi:hypothetical protein
VQQEKVLKSIHQPTIHPSTNHPGFTQFISHQNPMTYIYIYTIIFPWVVETRPWFLMVLIQPSGWWLTYPSEKNTSSSVEIIIPNIWKHKIHVPRPSSAMNSCDG